jgi:hypothetical protein
MFDMNLRIAKDYQANLRKQAQHERAERLTLSERIASIVRLVMPGLDVASGSVLPATH